MDIRYDPIFKAVFTKETTKSRTALSHLISSLIGRTVTVDTIIANEPPVDDTRQRYLRFDIACKTEEGELVNVEMAFNPNTNEQVRLEYHTARLFVGQGLHGQDKTYDDLKETYQIAILAKERFFPDENFAHTFLYYDPDNRVSLGGRTRIITVELVKTGPVADKPIEEMTNAELWAVFFQYHDENILSKQYFTSLRPAPLSGGGRLLSKSLYSTSPRRKNPPNNRTALSRVDEKKQHGVAQIKVPITTGAGLIYQPQRAP